LTPLSEAADDASRQRELERVIVEYATPTIQTVVARFVRSEGMLRRDDADDLVATVSLRLVRKLQSSGTLEENVVRNFENYVATLTYNAIHDYIRQRFPERSLLKNRIRDLLNTDERFALWSTDRGMACGIRAWRGREDLHPCSLDRASAGTAMLDPDRPEVAVEACFRRADGPLALETLVRAVAELWDVSERIIETADESIIEPFSNHATKYETRQFLEILWKEIGLLPGNQRAALLLNLRDPDGVNAVALFVIVGVARFREIAEAIGTSVDELAAMWESLPIDDLTIAARLNMTRQQVINLRRSARERLARRTVMYRSNEGRRQ
jgi:DNA-directed RNA polymerase specialized sigma24 family protein